MKEKILELILEYANSGRKIDLEFIKRVGEIYLTRYDMNPQDYISIIKYEDSFADLPEGFLAGYEFYRKSDSRNNLEVSHDQLRIELNAQFKNLKNYMTSREVTLLPYIYLTKAILHEFEHVAQKYKMIENVGNQDEVKLLASTRTLRLLSLYSNPKYYSLFPHERLAEFNAVNTIIQALEPVRYEAPVTLDYIRGFNAGLGIGNYDGSKIEECPTYKYCQLTDNLDVWKSLEFYDENRIQLIKNLCNYYSPEERFMYGLPLTKAEIETQYNILHKSCFHNR